MKRRFLLSQNGWEYSGTIDIEGDSILSVTTVNEHNIATTDKIAVNGAILTFDEEVEPTCCLAAMTFVTREREWICDKCCKYEKETFGGSDGH